jgi:hypothetical protein
MSIRWLLILGVLVLVAAGLLFVTGTIAACPAPLLATERQLSGPPLCTFEFFLNRYQILLASLIALTAALCAVAPVWRQLRLLSVQAATDLLPQLRQEAADIAADEAFLATAGQIEQHLVAAGELVCGPANPVGETVGALQNVWRLLNGLRQIGSADQYANRITLNTDERQRRLVLVSLLDDVSSAHNLVMQTISPPGGMPIGAYYEQIAPQFSVSIAATLPPVAERLKSEIAASAETIQKMNSELRARTELAVRTAKGFIG